MDDTPITRTAEDEVNVDDLWPNATDNLPLRIEQVFGYAMGVSAHNKRLHRRIESLEGAYATLALITLASLVGVILIHQRLRRVEK